MRSADDLPDPEIADNYRERLLTAGTHSPNYTGAEMTEDGGLILYGVGAATPNVQRVLDLAPHYVRAEWREVPHKAAELDAEVVRVMSAFPQLMSGSPAHDFAGLEFTTTDAELLEAAEPEVVLGTTMRTTILFGGPATAA